MSLVKRQASSSCLEPEAKRRRIEPQINADLCGCRHWFVLDGICSVCGSNVDKSEGRAFDYLVEGLQLSNEAVEFIKGLNTRLCCLKEKKLQLVLDLDHTLLHTRRVPELSDAEKYLIEEAGSRDDLWRITEGDSCDLLIKLRPFVREFLREANKLFVMYVYTKGNHEYAKIVMKLLDPQRVYFGDRVITRRDSPRVKTLDLVLADERGVVIVDDTLEVWPDHLRNVLEITRYNYYRERGVSRSYAEEKRDECEEEGALAKVLKFLKGVHEEFFKDGYEDRIDSRDVRPLLHT